MIVLDDKVFKEVDEVQRNSCDKCWFKINRNLGIDCLDLREEGLLPPCGRHHIKDGKSVIFVEVFSNLDVGSSFKYEDKELIVCDCNNSCEGCYFDCKSGYECRSLQDASAIPYCMADKRIDNKNVIFVEKVVK